MSRERKEKIVGLGQYVMGGALLAAAAAVTSALLLVELAAVKSVDRLLGR